MKRMMTAAALSAGMILLTAFAEENPVNPFQQANEQFFRGKWVTGNRQSKVKLTVSQKDGKQLITAAPDDPKLGYGTLYCMDKIKANPGQKVLISVKASGRGKIFLAITSMTAEGKYNGWFYRHRTLVEGSQDLSAVIAVPEKTEYVRPILKFTGGSEIIIEQLEYRFFKPAAASSAATPRAVRPATTHVEEKPIPADPVRIAVQPVRVKAHVAEKPSAPPAGNSVTGKDGLYTLTYKFTTEKHDALFCDLDVPLKGATVLTAQVNGDGKKHYLFVVVRDKSGECFYFPGPVIDFKGWKDVEIKFDYPMIHAGEKYASIWGGDGNQKPDFPLQGITIGLNDRPDKFKGQGKIQIRNIIIK